MINPPLNRPKLKTKKYWRTYTIPGAPRAAMNVIALIHDRQNGRCACCSVKIDVYGRARALERLSNGRPSFMICRSCSVALAIVHRSPERLSELQTYLEKVATAESGIDKTADKPRPTTRKPKQEPIAPVERPVAIAPIPVLNNEVSEQSIAELFKIIGKP